jgi:hypothetical protein
MQDRKSQDQKLKVILKYRKLSIYKKALHSLPKTCFKKISPKNRPLPVSVLLLLFYHQ